VRACLDPVYAGDNAPTRQSSAYERFMSQIDQILEDSRYEKRGYDIFDRRQEDIVASCTSQMAFDAAMRLLKS
jgi:hypothetical protein